MHYVLFLLLSTFAIGYFLSGVFIILKDSHSRLNKKFFKLCIETSLWAFGYAMMIVSESKEQANIFRIIGAVGWCVFSSTWLDFAIDLSCGKRSPFQRKLRILLYVPSVIFFWNTIQHPVELVITQTSFGFTELTPNTILDNLYAVYYISFLIISMLLIYHWRRRTTLNRERRLAGVILKYGVIAGTLGVTTDTALPNLGNQYFQMGIVFMSIAMIGLWKAITKYKMMTITPQYISDYIFKGVNNPIFFVNDKLGLINVNDIALETLGYRYEELNEEFFHKLLESNSEDMDKLKENGYVRNREMEFVRRNGTLLHFILSATVITDDFRDQLGIVIILQDVSEQKEAEQLLLNYNIELENRIAERTKRLENSNKNLQNEIQERISAEEKIVHMGYNDDLTGLPNRRFFNEYITKYIERIMGTNEIFAIMYMDIDDFKIINDTDGHQAGDELLQQLTNRMKLSIREGDLLARIGGDEFLFLITNLQQGGNQEQLIEHISSRIMTTFQDPFLIKGKENFVTASIGVAIYPNDGVDVETLIMNADITMYEAKANRKNNVKICNDDIKNRMLERTKFRNDLFRAMEKEELILHYHPQVNIQSGSIVGFEALLRWHYNGTSFISPKEFIPMAEATGLIVPIGYWVIQTVCSDVKRLCSVGACDLCVAVNLSRNQLMEPDFVQNVMKILKEYDLKPEFIEFEITERITLKDGKEINQQLRVLKEYGFRISIDDFGTEYSSFMNLKYFPVDKLKIAMEFVQESTNNKMDAAIVKTIIDLAHHLELNVIAEGVETEEQLEFIRSCNCNEVQGYYFYKPMPYSKLEQTVTAKRIERAV